MTNKTTTMPEIWQTFLISERDLSEYSWTEDQNGKYMIEVYDKSLKTVRTIRCKNVTKPVRWSWIREKRAR